MLLHYSFGRRKIRIAYLSHENRFQATFGLLIESLRLRFIMFFCIPSNIEQNNGTVCYLLSSNKNKNQKFSEFIDKIKSRLGFFRD